MPEHKEIFKTFEYHLLNDEKPSEFFNIEIKKEYFNDYPFNMLKKLKEIPQSEKHHPEGNVWNHTMMVIDEAALCKGESEEPRAFMWAALLHDIGKASATKLKKGRIVAYDHDKIGAVMAIDFLKALSDENSFIKKVSELVRWHMQILFVVKELPFAEINKMKSRVSYKEIALLGLCDRLGRGELSPEKIREEKETIKHFIKKCERPEILFRTTVKNLR